MTDEEYSETQQKLILLAQALRPFQQEIKRQMEEAS